jgi:predicted GTPase
MVKKIMETVKDKEYVARYYDTLQEAFSSITPGFIDHIITILCEGDDDTLGIHSDLERFTFDS